ncbi:polh-1, partial [Pristionchus pacificus]|uniref:DNA polymerase eta n=1 Tax=Pristionchus pacificus TaxID=54126 RepID=A0A8R1ZBS8_PRIPA
QMSRVIVLVDMDCFYAQVEQRDKPSLWGKPVGVLQYSANGQSGLIAVSYEARPFGVKRGMTANQCKELCPDIEICLVPQGEYADKADIQKYRDASAEVFAVLGSIDSRIILEKASVDEAFLDCTAYVESRVTKVREETIQRLLDPACLPTSFIVDGKEDEKDEDETEDEEETVDEEARLKRKNERIEMIRKRKIEEFIEKCRFDDEFLKIALAAEFAERLREKVREKTQFYCSAGVGNNKTMAKLVCAAHKPRKQSFIPPGSEVDVLRNTKVSSVRGLGGKLGRSLTERLGINTMGELYRTPSSVLTATFPDNAPWLMQIARGEDYDKVDSRVLQRNLGVGKNFPGTMAIYTNMNAKFWLNGLTKELRKRMADDKIKHRRLAQKVVVHVTTDVSTSKSVKVGATEEKEGRLFEKLWPVMQSMRKGPGEGWKPPIFNISLSAGRFLEGLPSKENSIIGWVERRTKQLEEMEGKDAVEKLNRDAAAEEKRRLEREEMGEEEGEGEEMEGIFMVDNLDDDDDDDCLIVE